MGIAKNLNFDMSGAEDVFLDQAYRIAKSRLRLAFGRGEGCGKIRRRLDQPHALAAAPGARLDEDGVADFRCAGSKRFRITRSTMPAGHDRHACAFHQRLGCIFQAHGADCCGGWSDENQTRRRDRRDKIGVLAEKTIAGVDRLCPGGVGGGDDPVALQIAVGDGRPADTHRLIRHDGVARLGIGIGIDSNRADAHPSRRGDDAAGNLAPVGHEDL